jgi:hypothetical protein
MNLQHRIELLSRLGQYILSDDTGWQQAKEKAGIENGWFIPAFVNRATEAIAANYLKKRILEKWYPHPETITPSPKTAGIIMAGNIPLVGFHDFLCVFISGHKALIKTSSKDKVLLNHLVEKLISYDKEVEERVQFSDMLKGCDAYIATGSNNSGRYFEYYFGKYPHIIRRNKTSVAVVTGQETKEELERLADDVHLYFGMGCRNVTKLYVPSGYDFVALLDAFKKYNHLAEHHKYKNNFDYNLALYILNNNYYMTNGSILLVEEPSVFSPISQLNYEFYHDHAALSYHLQKVAANIQCIVGKGHIPFGQAQNPGINDYADGVDTMEFLAGL